MNGGKDLSEAIESLPDILNRKANLEAHTNILQAVMKKVAAREVPTYFEVLPKLCFKRSCDMFKSLKHIHTCGML